jgi:hypothetical protein
MHVYTSEELDVMAEAYLLALQQLSEESVPPELTLQLVQHIGAGVASGNLDERALAMTALKKVDRLAWRVAARRAKPRRPADAPADRIATV